MERCSVLAAERDESMIGTAFPQGGVLLVEQPGAWGPQGLSDSDFDASVAAALQKRADAAGLRLLAIRRPERVAGSALRRAWAVRPSGSTVTAWSTFEDDGDLLDAPLDGTAGEPAGEPAYLVCTHGKRDLCCAMEGRPIAAALNAVRPGQVWGCSHTGGHRFAPVVVALPTAFPGAAMYGRVTPSDTVHIADATDAGRVLPELLRGLTGHPAYVQAALAHVLTDHPVPGDWQVLGSLADAADRWEVDLAGPRSLTVAVLAETTAEPMVSCGKPDLSPQTHYRVLSS
ncbi:sucrase ferredoxin [Nocardioides montaniterrae]